MAEIAWPFDHLSRGGYDVIVADPPWQFAHWSDKGQAKSAAPHYRVMTLDAIRALPVADLAAKRATLLLWTSAPLLPEGLDVARAWGFRYVSRLGWRKTTVNGKRAIGTGYWVRSMHEDVIIAVRSKPRFAKAMPSLIDGVRREHSRKPEEFYRLLAEATPGASRCDLFSRETRLGFAAWGDEAGKFDAAA